MDKNAIKKYAVWARRELISRVSQKALQYGISENEYADKNAESVNGKLLTAEEKHQRTALIEQINKNGYQQVMEEVAYTWFNRFCALRFMEVNGYLPTHIRVFSDEENNFKPQILAEAMNLNLPGLKLDKVYELKNDSKEEELFKYLLIVQCNALSSILPGMFQKISDYTELLFPDNLLRQGSVVEQLVTQIPEEDWKDAVQIIGWLYQFYNIEPKDKVFENLKKNIKISRDTIPAATQLFTPDWIVRYMVENSLGRLWLEGHPESTIKENWRYYLKEAEQEESVKVQLDKIRSEYARIEPKDIKCIDPCMGSGHILVYMFNVLVQIYNDYGYNTRDAVEMIVQNNLYGLDIDDRAAQLAYFAVMMKARQYDRRFLERGVQPQVFAIQESNNLSEETFAYIVDNNTALKNELQKVIDLFRDAKEYGSILQVPDIDFAVLYKRFDEIFDDVSLFQREALENYLPLVKQAELLAQKYDVVVTNPPYMGSDSMNFKLKKYLQHNYNETRYDLYAVCIDRFRIMASKYLAMITQHSFLYAYCFRGFRENLIKHTEFVSAVHLGARAFEEISGEIVQTISFILSPRPIGYRATFIPLTQYVSQKEKYFYQAAKIIVETKEFGEYDNYIFAYSLTELMRRIYVNTSKIGDVFSSKAGVVTGNDDYFLRLWYEINISDFNTIAVDLNNKYVPYSKGGTFVKWYGNVIYALKLMDLYNDALVNQSVRRGDREAYFKPCIGWSQMGGGNKKNFSLLNCCVCGTATPTILSKDEESEKYVLGFLNTKIPTKYIECFNPLMSTYISDICNLPYVYKKDIFERVIEIVNTCISYAREDWDSFETSWDFKKHPLI